MTSPQKSNFLDVEQRFLLRIQNLWIVLFLYPPSQFYVLTLLKWGKNLTNSYFFVKNLLISVYNRGVAL